MQKVRGAAWAGVVVAGVLGLGACTGDDRVPPVTSSGPTSITSSPTTSEPTLAIPELPTEAADETDVGASAWAEHYFALANYAYQTGDTTPLSKLSDPACQGCAALVDAVVESTADGSVFTGEAFAVISANTPQPSGGVAIVAVAYGKPSMTRHYPDGTTATTDPAPDERVRMRLRWNGAWLVEAIGP